MLYAYAIEPDTLTTWDKCRNTLNLMGFQHGRAIAAYPSKKEWKALVHAACRKNTELGDLARKRVFRTLDLLSVKMVLSGATYDYMLLPEEERWFRNAVANQAALSPAFHAILSTQNPDDHPDVVLEEDIEESHPMLDVPREAPVLRQPEELVAHIGTLVRNSRELLLIDPHFDPLEYRWRPVVKACIGLAAESFCDDPSVTIHTLDADKKPSLTEFRRRCEQHLPEMISGKVTSVHVCRWRIRNDGPHDFHGRYVLTDRGGYKLDKGLDEERGVEQSVGLLDDQEWKRVRDGFGEASPFFDMDGDVTVSRTN